MKKKITTSHELLSQIAARGDAAAFYSLISSSLREYFLKLRSHGETLEQSTEKIFECAVTLFKKFQHTHPDNFENWLESELETIFNNTNNDNEVVLDKNLFLQCDSVLSEAQKQLLRTASAMKNSNPKKRRPGFLSRHKMAFILITLVLPITILTIAIFWYYGVKIDMSISKNGTFLHNGTSNQDTLSMADSMDSIGRADSTTNDTLSKPPEQESKSVPPPPPPKPRPRVTHTPPPAAPEPNASESMRSSHSLSSDQVQQSLPARTEQLSLPSGYSSQSQATESQTISTYNTSGSSSSTIQQSSQSQNQNLLEQNQP